MASVRFLGAAQEVTGSCHLLSSPAVGKVLLDCGMHQGGAVILLGTTIALAHAQHRGQDHGQYLGLTGS